ncbi:hypothetical protein DV515_00007422 [Chloebia gouldiae]|uniref:Uncharacterized protein n=1 Tax=Chloebia gouldiae TaxID=44316 RepID=A0A3L8SI96_CHLGU|nr:hypothetical protein DV515_00007422 [Chloebia gouldiae]
MTSGLLWHELLLDTGIDNRSSQLKDSCNHPVPSAAFNLPGRLQTQTGCTCCVQLSLLQLGLIYHQGGAAGQLQQPTDQAVGRVVLVGHEACLVHALDAHPQVVGLQGEKPSAPVLCSSFPRECCSLQLQLGWELHSKAKLVTATLYHPKYPNVMMRHTEFNTQASHISISICSLNGEQESISSACLDQAEAVRTHPPGNAYCWHQLLDEAVQVLREGAVAGAAAQVDGEFSQRKHVPSGIAAPKAAQPAGFQNTHTKVSQLLCLPCAVPKELSQAEAAAHSTTQKQRSQNRKDVFIPLLKSVLEILSALKAALKRHCHKLVFYQYLLLFQSLKSAFVCIVTGQLYLNKVLLK